MINLRYHIVSITAVFLALGIGLAFGAAFIDRATVGVLNDNIAAIEEQNDDLEAENGRLNNRLDAAEALEDELLDQGLPQLVNGRLADVPVVVIGVRGIDEDPVTGEGGLVDTLQTAGAELGGVLWLTDRLVLDDDAELNDLAAVLGEEVTDAARLRAELVQQLADVLAAASSPATPVEGVAPVPPLVQELLETQFLELDAADTPPASFEVLPAAGARFVTVSGPRSVAGVDAEVVVPLLRRLTDPALGATASPVVVAVQSGPPADSEPVDGVEPAELRVAFVGPLRSDDSLRERVSTIDDLESFVGLIASILALEHGDAGQFGHYGVGEGAQALLPPPLTGADGG